MFFVGISVATIAIRAMPYMHLVKTTFTFNIEEPGLLITPLP